MTIEVKFDPKELNEEDLVGIANCFAEAYNLPMTKHSERAIREKGMKSIQKINQFQLSYANKESGKNGTVLIQVYDDCIGIHGNLERTEADQRSERVEFARLVKEYFLSRTTEDNDA